MSGHDVPSDFRRQVEEALDASFDDYDYPSPSGPISAFALTVDAIVAAHEADKIAELEDLILGDFHALREEPLDRYGHMNHNSYTQHRAVDVEDIKYRIAELRQSLGSDLSKS